MKRLFVVLLVLSVMVSIGLPFAIPKTVEAIDYDYKIPFVSVCNAIYQDNANWHPGVCKDNSATGGTDNKYWPMPCAGTWSHLIVETDNAPGAGASRGFTMWKNEASTSLGVSLGAADVRSSDLTNEVAVAAGDYVKLRSTVTGAPVTTYFAHSLIFEPTVVGQQPFFGYIEADIKGSATMWSSIAGGNSNPPLSSAYENTCQTVVPVDGVFKNLYGRQWTGLTQAGDTLDITFRLNSTNTTLALNWNGTSELKSDTVHDVAVSAGDLVNFQVNCSGIHYPMVNVGLLFVPDDPTVWWLTRPYNFDKAGDNLFSTPNLGKLNEGDHWNTVEYGGLFPSDIRIQGITVHLALAPGVGKTRTFVVRKNSIDTAITVTISGLDDFAQSASVVNTSDDFDRISIKSTETGAPTACVATFSLWGTAAELPIPVLTLPCTVGVTSSYENITTYSNDNSELIGGADWSFESIIATGNHTINVATILAFRIGSPTTLNAYLFDENTTTFVPVGAALASGTIDVSGITDNTVGEWIDIALTPDVSLIAGQSYDLVITQDAAGANDVVWNSTYKNVGNYAHSHDSGATWGYDTDPTPRDGLFVLRYCLPITAPTALHIIAIDQESITLAWQETTGIPTFQVNYKVTGYPVDETDGTVAYFDNITSCTVDNLTSGTTYYFGVWSYYGGLYSLTGAYCTATTSAGWPYTNYGGAIGDTTDETILGNSPIGAFIEFIAQYSELPEKTVGLLGYSSLFLFMMVAIACYNRSVSMTLICGIGGLALGVSLGVYAVVFLIMAVILGLSLGTLRGGQPSGG